MQQIGRRGTERQPAEDRHGVVSRMPRGGSVLGDERSGKAPIGLGDWSGVSSDVGGTGDWRFGLMRELRALMAYLIACEAGAAPSPRQRASCMRRLDALSAALRASPRRDSGLHRGEGLRVDTVSTRSNRSATLRPREIEALRWRHKGLLPKEIAREMGITLLTARSYIRDAARKLDASGWEAAVRRATELGII